MQASVSDRRSGSPNPKMRSVFFRIAIFEPDRDLFFNGSRFDRKIAIRKKTDYLQCFLQILTRDRDSTVTIPWPYSDRDFLTFRTVILYSMIVPDRSPFLTVPDRFRPFLSVPERFRPFLSVFYRFMSVYDRFMRVFDRFMTF